jgi:predicted GTPase
LETCSPLSPKGRAEREYKEKMRMEVSKFRLAVSIAILAITLLTVYFLVQDIYRLQEQYEQWETKLPPSNYPWNQEMYEMIKRRLDEIQNVINLRMMAVVLVVAAPAVALLVLNKRKLFKQKYAVKPELNTLEACSPPSPK